mmetsp:Transcript_52378/g.98287  ORF Transcript_52378/g.98287 Transcript_52378/m.98287 type:complete len:224 (+) Transcript_52378:334-1005(+)
MTCSKYCARSLCTRICCTAVRKRLRSPSCKPCPKGTKLWLHPWHATMSPAPHDKPWGALRVPHAGQAMGKRLSAACCLAIRSMAAIARLCRVAASWRFCSSCTAPAEATLLPPKASIGSCKSTGQLLRPARGLLSCPAARRLPPAAASAPADASGECAPLALSPTSVQDGWSLPPMSRCKDATERKVSSKENGAAMVGNPGVPAWHGHHSPMPMLPENAAAVA